MLEPCAELRACHEFREPRGDPTCDVDAAPRTERQGNVSGDRSQHRTKQVEGRPRDWAVTIQCGLGNLGGIALRGVNSIERDDSAVEILQPAPRNDSLRRHVPELPAQIVHDRVFAVRGSRHSRVTALAGDHN